MQRLRIRFSRGEELKFISHLDIVRLWERALRRARVQLAYSEGFSPHPKISVAAPLSVGTTSDAELMDIQVAGRERFAVVELVETEPRLVADVRILEWEDVDIKAAREPLAPLRESFREYLRLLLTLTGQWVRRVELPDDPLTLAEFVSAGLQVSDAIRQRLLERSSLRALMHLQLELLAAEIPKLRRAVEERVQGRSN